MNYIAITHQKFTQYTMTWTIYPPFPFTPPPQPLTPLLLPPTKKKK